MEKNTTIELKIADIMIRLAALEKLLLDKQVIVKEEYLKQVTEITNEAISMINNK